MELLWGVDLGGTKIEAVVIRENEPSSVIARLRVPTEADKGYQHVIAQIEDVISRLESESNQHRAKRIGVGTPGSTDPTTGLIRNSNTVCLNGKPFHADLSNLLGCDVVMSNDANCFALAEATLGAAQGGGTVFGIIMGTGVGGGIIVDGKVLIGKNGIAGEWGHNVVDPRGDPCYCGRNGCVETMISGPAIELSYTRMSGRNASLAHIVEDHRSGTSPEATKTVELLCERFGQCLAQVVNILDPDIIVLGGGLGQINELYDRGTFELKKHVFHEKPNIDVRKPTLGDSAGVFGAALLVKN